MWTSYGALRRGCWPDRFHLCPHHPLASLEPVPSVLKSMSFQHAFGSRCGEDGRRNQPLGLARSHTSSSSLPPPLNLTVSNPQRPSFVGWIRSPWRGGWTTQATTLPPFQIVLPPRVKLTIPYWNQSFLSLIVSKHLVGRLDGADIQSSSSSSLSARS